jgi:hypothetical protein
MRRAARGIAIAIAIASLIDPAIAVHRATKPAIVVLASDAPRDSARANAIARSLASTFTVLSAPFANASGSVIVGDAPPVSNEGLPTPAFAVAANTTEPSVRITGLQAPRRASSGSRIPVTVNVDAIGARGRTLDVELRAGGVVVARTARPVGDAAPIRVAFTYVAPDTGAVVLRATAALGDLNRRDSADAVIDVRDARWRVLFFDARPSWTSTFVRRAVERDSRFAVTTRIATSRGVNTVAGSAPTRLDDPSIVSSFDAVVVGAPDALSGGDIRGLETFARRRGGSVVVLLDRAPSPSDADALARLIGAPGWRTATTNTVVPIAASTDTVALRASELVWPATLPLEAAVVGSARVGSATVPLVWRAPLGSGQLIVDGALDAWRARDPSQSAFETFWPSLLAGAAAAAVPPLDVEIASPSLTPGEQTTVTVTARDSSILSQPRERAVAAIVEPTRGGSGGPASPDTIPLWPGALRNTLVGVLRAPAGRGAYVVRVRLGAVTAEAPLVVDLAALHARRGARDLLVAWSTVRGGRVLGARGAGDIAALLRGAIHPPDHAALWHPFRSAWWIVPFALALSLDWWLRRRSGLA